MPNSLCQGHCMHQRNSGSICVASSSMAATPPKITWWYVPAVYQIWISPCTCWYTASEECQCFPSRSQQTNTVSPPQCRGVLDDPHSCKRKNPKPCLLTCGSDDQRWSTMVQVLEHQARLHDRHVHHVPVNSGPPAVGCKTVFNRD